MGDQPHPALHWWQTRSFVVVLAAISIVPLLWPTIPPLVDLPGHMGRYRVQLSLGEYPWLLDWYDFRWQLIGNLGIDLLIIPMAAMFGLELAVKLIVITIPLLTVTGILWIAREVHGRIPPTALFALPLAYSFPFQFGFVNFALAMAIALNAFALWLRLGRTGHFRMRAAIFVPLSCALWVCHTFGWGALGVLAFSAEMIRRHDARTDRGPVSWVKAWVRAGLGCLPLALPVVLMVAWRSGQHVGGKTADWFNWEAKLHWVEMVLRDRWQLFDYVSLGVMGAVLVLGMVVRPLQYSRNLALSALFLLAVYILLPRIVFGSAYADMRLAPFMIAIAVIAVRPRAGWSWRAGATIAAIGLAFFLVRIGGTTLSYWMFSQDYDRELKALDHVPVGARLVTFVGMHVEGAQCERTYWKMSRLEHIPALALERRLAYANDQWSMAGAQLLTVKYARARRFAHDPSEIVTSQQCPREWWRPISMALARFPRDAFDYVWLVRPPPYDPRFNAGLIEIWRDGDSVLFRIDHDRPGIQISDQDLRPRIRPLPSPY